MTKTCCMQEHSLNHRFFWFVCLKNSKFFLSLPGESQANLMTVSRTWRCLAFVRVLGYFLFCVFPFSLLQPLGDGLIPTESGVPAEKALQCQRWPLDIKTLQTWIAFLWCSIQKTSNERITSNSAEGVIVQLSLPSSVTEIFQIPVCRTRTCEFQKWLLTGCKNPVLAVHRNR